MTSQPTPSNTSFVRRATTPLCWLIDFWFAPIAAERFRFWQRAFALTFIIFIGQWSLYGPEWLTDIGYHTSPEATDSVYPAPFPLLPRAALIPFLVVMFGASILVMLDLGGRAVKAIVLACAIYIQIADQISSFTLNKLYIVGFFLITFAPKTVRSARGELQSAWPVRVLQATLLIQYADAGLCKAIHGDWLYKPAILYGHSVGIYRTEIAGWLMNHMPPLFWVVSSLFALSFELGAPILFLVRRLHWFGIIAGTAMHLVIAVLMKDLIFFSLQMISFYLVFFSDDLSRKLDGWVTRQLGSLRQRFADSKTQPSQAQ